MYAYGVGSLRFLTERGLQHLILQAAGSRLHAFALGVLLEKLLAVGFGLTGYLSLQFLEILAQHLLCLLVGDLRLLVGEDVLDTLCQVLIIERLYAATHQVLTHTES